jgi:AcrR family transcriptional regulator
MELTMNVRHHEHLRTRLTAGTRRSQILSAAVELFSERGFFGARTKELAERAGVSEALIFRHFPNKAFLVEAILESVGAEEKVQAAESLLNGPSPREALVILAERMFANFGQHPQSIRLLFFGILERPDMAQEIYQRFFSRVLAVETQLLARAYAERPPCPGSPPPDPAIAARSFHGTLLFYRIAGSVAQVEPAPKDPRAAAEAIVDLYLPRGNS